MDKRFNLKPTTILSSNLGGGSDLVTRRLRDNWTLEEATTIPAGMSRLRYKNIKTVVNLHKEGRAYREICEKTGLSYGCVVNMIESHYANQTTQPKVTPLIKNLLEVPEERLENLLKSLSKNDLAALVHQAEDLAHRASLIYTYSKNGSDGLSHRESINRGRKAAARVKRWFVSVNVHGESL